MAGLTFGDNRVPFGGINDETDDFDGKPGSLSPESYNVIPNRSFSSLLSRGAFRSKNAFTRATGTAVVGTRATAHVSNLIVYPPTFSVKIRVLSITMNDTGGGYTRYSLDQAGGITFSGGGGSGAAGTAVLSTGDDVGVSNVQVVNGGTGYVAPTITFDLGPSTIVQATGTVNVSGGVITSITMTNNGQYTDGEPPTITLNTGGSGSGAILSVNMIGGSISSITVTNQGSNYTSVPSVVIPVNYYSGSQAVATAVMELGSISVTVPSKGYASAPSCSITGGGGSGATGTAVLSGVNLSSITITARGTGFTSPPTVTVGVPGVVTIAVDNGGSGYQSSPVVSFTPSGATATANLTAGVVTSITVNTNGTYGTTPTVTIADPQSVASVSVTAGGGYYWQVPTVSFSGGGGSGAAGTAVLTSGAVTSVTMTNYGTGYTSAPSVSFSYPDTVDFPSVGNGLKTGMTIEKILHMDKFRVARPEEKTVTILVALCKWTVQTAVDIYMVRVFMSPSYNSTDGFGVDSSWQEKEIWYIDEVRSNITPTQLTSPERYIVTVAAMPNGGYFGQDFEDGYIYLEDNDAGIFTSPSNHIAEGDKIINSTFNSYSDLSAIIALVPESAHTEWHTSQKDTVRFHKNLETGFIPYQDLCSRTATFFDAYSFESEMVDEKIVLSVHTGDTGRASFTMCLNYVNRTFFDTGRRVYGKADYIYDGGDTLYDKRLVYGFPGYENINKSNVATVFDGKTIKRWTSARTDMSDSSVAGSGTVTATGGYNNIMGKLTISSGFTSGDLTNNMYAIESCDVSVVVDDFVIASFDLHGRTGAYKEFETHLYNQGGEVKRGYSSAARQKNYPDMPELDYTNGVPKTGDEVSWPNGIISAIKVTNPGPTSPNTAYSDTAKITVTGTNIPSTATPSVDGKPAILSLSQAIYEQEDKERDIADIKRKIKKLDSNDYEDRNKIKKLWKKIQTIENRIHDGTIKDVTVLYGGNLYDSFSDAVSVVPATTGTAASFTVTIDYSVFYDFIVAIHDGYRYGLQYNGVLRLGSTSTATYVKNNILACDLQIPIRFNRNMTGVAYVISQNFNSSTVPDHTLLEYLNGHCVLTDDMSSGFDYRLYYELDVAPGRDYGYMYTKVNRIDKQKFDNADIGGHHLHLTGNPALAFNPDDDVDNPNFYSVLWGSSVYGSSKMKKDLSFGNKSFKFIRDRLFACDAVYQEYQMGSIQDTQGQSLFEIFFSPIPQFGGNFHQYNASSLQFTTREAGKAVAVVGVSTSGSETENQNHNNLLCLCDRGYIYIDLQDNDESNFRPYYNKGNGCVSRKSVVSHNGVAFWAGENDVFMWDGRQAVPITRLGDSSINKTWRDIPIANKRLAVGVYNEDRKQYWLLVDEESQPAVIYVFDFALNNIYRLLSPLPQITSHCCAGFIDGKVWLSGGDYISSTPHYVEGYVYDESQIYDFSKLDTVTDVNIPAQVIFNNIKGSDRMSVLKSVSLTYTGVTPTLSPYVDGVTYSTALTLDTGTKLFKEHKINYRGFSTGNNRGRRYAVKVFQTSGYFELFDLTLNIDNNVPQNTLVSGVT